MNNENTTKKITNKGGIKMNEENKVNGDTIEKKNLIIVKESMNL